jgi:hypothetical protein
VLSRSPDPHEPVRYLARQEPIRKPPGTVPILRQTRSSKLGAEQNGTVPNGPKLSG